MSPSPLVHRDGLLGRLADTMFVHRRTVVLGWIVVLVLAVVAGMSLKGEYSANYTTPGSDSQAAATRLETKFAGRTGDAVDIVWHDDAGARTPAVSERIDRLLARATSAPGIVAGTTTRSAEVSPDGTTAIVRLALDRAPGAVPATTGQRIADLLKQTDGSGLTVAANGTIGGLTTTSGSSAEVVGVVVAALVLLAAFGTVVAAGLPLLSAGFGVAIAIMLGLILTAVIQTPDWATQVSIMIGLGVGIDYALLILTRYRTATRAGRSPRQANVEAMTTAGHAVLVAGATVVIALLGLLLMRLPYLNGVALAASVTVATVMVATATLLPAIIGLAHTKIDRLQLGRLGLPPADADRTFGARWARGIARRPVVAAIAAVALLGVLASPVTGLRLGLPDAGNDAKATTTRQAYDMVARGFGPGANGPLIAVATTQRPGAAQDVERMRAAVEHVPGVVAVSPAQYNQAKDTAIVAITPTEGPSSTSTKKLVSTLRDGPLARAGIPVSLGGATASGVDQATTTGGRLPLFIGAVVALSFLLLVGSFRAPLIALKAGVMTVLSIAASYGVVALIAQGGWAGQLVGIDSNVPVPPFIPVMMFAVLFGLSMDYEVFLVSRIKEERERLGDARTAVTVGQARTAKVIMAAALIMFSVFGAFALTPELILKLIGVGLAAAILIDALVVRMVLVPAVMRLMGERAWWTPRGLRRTTRPVPVVGAATTAPVS